MSEFDFSEVDALVDDLQSAAQQSLRKVAPVVKRGALNIKNQLRDEAGRSRHFKMARHISYDIEDGGRSAAIGPEKVGAGNLGNIAYFGGANGGGGTIPDPIGALEDETPRFEQALADALEEFL